MDLSHGDYTRLARDYAAYRPGYAPRAAGVLVSTAAGSLPVEEVAADVRFVDVGAGTGIWTRQVARLGCPTIAIEPNDAMRELGRREAPELGIEWRAGRAEATGLPDASCDLLTMASSFHWTDFDAATAEFVRVLRPGGLFAALWNTRRLEANPLLVEIEAELDRRVPELERRSSGGSKVCEDLVDRLGECGRFDDLAHFELEHSEEMSLERYLGIWRSVNDVRVQAGEQRFTEFLEWIEARCRGSEPIVATYTTKVALARVP